MPCCMPLRFNELYGGLRYPSWWGYAEYYEVKWTFSDAITQMWIHSGIRWILLEKIFADHKEDKSWSWYCTGVISMRKQPAPIIK